MQNCRNLVQIWDMGLPEKLIKLKDKRGVSSREIARSLGDVSPTTVGRWLDGTGEPSLSQALKLAAYFTVPLSYLASDEASTAPSELPSDEQAVLRMYQNLKLRGALDEASAVEGLALAAQTAVGRMAKGAAVNSLEDLPEAGFESQQSGRKKARDTRRG